MMMTTTLLRSAVIAAAVTIAAGSVAQALPAAGTYSATEAVSDSYHGGNHDHSLWLPGIPGGADFFFSPSAGELTVTNGPSNTMHLEGLIFSQSNVTDAFIVSIDFQHYSEFPSSAFVGGTPTPKKELLSSAYSNNGGPVDTSTWDYYVLLESSKLIGVGGTVAGITLDLTQRPNSGTLYGPYLTQIGIGANGKNVEFGLSTWFNYSGGGYSGTGDVNINLSGGGGGTSIAEPAALALFGLGLAGVGLAARRRRSV